MAWRRAQDLVLHWRAICASCPIRQNSFRHLCGSVWWQTPGATGPCPGWWKQPKRLNTAATGKDIDASEAEKVGLVNTVVPHADLEKVTYELAEKLAQGATRAIGIIKRTLTFFVTTQPNIQSDSVHLKNPIGVQC